MSLIVFDGGTFVADSIGVSYNSRYNALKLYCLNDNQVGGLVGDLAQGQQLLRRFVEEGPDHAWYEPGANTSDPSSATVFVYDKNLGVLFWSADPNQPMTVEPVEPFAIGADDTRLVAEAALDAGSHARLAMATAYETSRRRFASQYVQPPFLAVNMLLPGTLLCYEDTNALVAGADSAAPTWARKINRVITGYSPLGR